jgi:hypothetical protein
LAASRLAFAVLSPSEDYVIFAMLAIKSIGFPQDLRWLLPNAANNRTQQKQLRIDACARFRPRD